LPVLLVTPSSALQHVSCWLAGLRDIILRNTDITNLPSNIWLAAAPQQLVAASGDGGGSSSSSGGGQGSAESSVALLGGTARLTVRRLCCVV
jgi:hypothetical protein